MARQAVTRSHALRRTLVEELEAVGVLPGRWRQVFTAVPRHWFLPDTFWSQDGDDSYTAFDRSKDENRWLEGVYRDSAAVILLDGDPQTDPRDQIEAKLCCERPQVVARTLVDLELEPDNKVLTLGAATGWPAGLIRAHLRGGEVTNVEVHPGLAARAAQSLARFQLDVRVRVGHVADGWAPDAPFDRIVSASAIQGRVPRAWIDQVDPGGLIVTPWSTAWGPGGTLKLRKDSTGSAEGRFASDGACMACDGGEVPPAPGLVPPTGHPAQQAVTSLNLWDVLGSPDARFAIGSLLPDTRCFGDVSASVGRAGGRLWLVASGGDSWAAVDRTGDPEQKHFPVRQFGPRRIFEEVSRAHAWYVNRGSPAIDRYGLSVSPEGRQQLWLDSATQEVPSRNQFPPDQVSADRRVRPRKKLERPSATAGP